MNIKSELNNRDVKIVSECLAATVEGDFFPEWEFESLFGVSRELVHQASTAWPDVDSSDREITDAIIGSLNNLLGYPHRKEEDWARYISVPPAEVKVVLDKLLALGL